MIWVPANRYFSRGCFEKTDVDGYPGAILDHPDFQIPAPDYLLLRGFVQTHQGMADPCDAVENMASGKSEPSTCSVRF